MPRIDDQLVAAEAAKTVQPAAGQMAQLQGQLQNGIANLLEALRAEPGVAPSSLAQLEEQASHALDQANAAFAPSDPTSHEAAEQLANSIESGAGLSELSNRLGDAASDARTTADRPIDLDAPPAEFNRQDRAQSAARQQVAVCSAGQAVAQAALAIHAALAEARANTSSPSPQPKSSATIASEPTVPDAVTTRATDTQAAGQTAPQANGGPLAGRDGSELAASEQNEPAPHDARTDELGTSDGHEPATTPIEPSSPGASSSREIATDAAADTAPADTPTGPAPADDVGTDHSPPVDVTADSSADAVTNTGESPDQHPAPDDGNDVASDAPAATTSDSSPDAAERRDAESPAPPASSEVEGSPTARDDPTGTAARESTAAPPPSQEEAAATTPTPELDVERATAAATELANQLDATKGKYAVAVEEARAAYLSHRAAVAELKATPKTAPAADKRAREGARRAALDARRSTAATRDQLARQRRVEAKELKALLNEIPAQPAPHVVNETYVANATAARNRINAMPMAAQPPRTLVGTDTARFRKAVEVELAANSDHPLRVLLDPGNALHSSHGLRRHVQDNDARIVEAGHAKSRWLADAIGQPEVIVLMSAATNQQLGRTIETGRNAWQVTPTALDIDGIAADPALVVDLIAQGHLPMSVLDSATRFELAFAPLPEDAPSPDPTDGATPHTTATAVQAVRRDLGREQAGHEAVRELERQEADERARDLQERAQRKLEQEKNR